MLRNVKLASTLTLTTLLTAPSWAVDGTWTLDGNDTWDITNLVPWSSGAGPVAQGADFTAFFDTIDITANRTVTLTDPLAIGNLSFADLDASSGNAFGWTLTGSTLTLDTTSGTPTITTTRPLTISSVLAGNDGMIKAGGGTLTLTNTNTITGTTTISAGKLVLLNGASVGGNIVISNSGENLEIDGGAANTIAGDISGSGAIKKLNSAGILTLTGNNSFTGGVTIQDGTFQLSTATEGGLGSGNGGIKIGYRGTIRSTDNDARTITKKINFNNAGGGVTFGGTQGGSDNLGDLNFTNTFTGNALNGSTRITVTNSTTVTLANQFSGQRVNKWGTGTLVLDGATHTTSGLTTVNEGLLVINGTMNNSSVSITGGNPNGGGTLGGTGTVKDITLNAGGAIAPGNSIGTLNTNNGALTWNGEDSGSFAQMIFELDNTADLGLAATSDMLNLGAGVLTKGTGSIFAFDFLSTGAAGNTYTLLTFGSSSGFSVTDFSYANLAGDLTGTFNLTTDSLQFTVVPEPATLALMGLGGLMILGGRRRN